MTLNSCADRFGGSSESLVSLGGLALLPPPSPRNVPDVDLGLFEAAAERVRLRSMVQQRGRAYCGGAVLPGSLPGLVGDEDRDAASGGRVGLTDLDVIEPKRRQLPPAPAGGGKRRLPTPPGTRPISGVQQRKRSLISPTLSMRSGQQPPPQLDELLLQLHLLPRPPTMLFADDEAAGEQRKDASTEPVARSPSPASPVIRALDCSDSSTADEGSSAEDATGRPPNPAPYVPPRRRSKRVRSEATLSPSSPLPHTDRLLPEERRALVCSSCGSTTALPSDKSAMCVELLCRGCGQDLMFSDWNDKQLQISHISWEISLHSGTLSVFRGLPGARALNLQKRILCLRISDITSVSMSKQTFLQKMRHLCTLSVSYRSHGMLVVLRLLVSQASAVNKIMYLRTAKKLLAGPDATPEGAPSSSGTWAAPRVRV